MLSNCYLTTNSTLEREWVMRHQNKFFPRQTHICSTHTHTHKAFRKPAKKDQSNDRRQAGKIHIFQTLSYTFAEVLFCWWCCCCCYCFPSAISVPSAAGAAGAGFHPLKVASEWSPSPVRPALVDCAVPGIERNFKFKPNRSHLLPVVVASPGHIH